MSDSVLPSSSDGASREASASSNAPPMSASNSLNGSRSASQSITVLTYRDNPGGGGGSTIHSSSSLATSTVHGSLTSLASNASIGTATGSALPSATRRGFVDLDGDSASVRGRQQGYGTPIDPNFLDRGRGFVNTPTTHTSSTSHTSNLLSSQLYGSKRDLWEKTATSSLKPDSIFFQATNTQPNPTIIPQPQPQHVPMGDAASPPPARKSRNSIFDTPQIIMKPAIKMTEEELAVLRSGGNVLDTDLVSPASTTLAPPPSTSNPVTTTKKEPEPALTKAPMPPVANPDSALNLPKKQPSFDIPIPPQSSGGRRGFVDLDEVMAAASNSSRKSIDDTLRSHKPSSMPPPPAKQLSKRLSTPIMKAEPESMDTSAVHSNRKSVGPGSRYEPPEPEPTLSIITNPASSSDNIHLSFLPTRKNYLGEGRYAQVYRAYYTITPKVGLPQRSKSGRSSEDIPENTTPTPEDPQGEESDMLTAPTAIPTAELLPCAVKRLHANPECQEVGLAELQILRRVGNHPNIVQLIGSKDENDLESTAVKERLKAGGPIITKRKSGSSMAGDILPSPTQISAAFNVPKTNLPPRLLILLEFEAGGTMWDFIEATKESGGIGTELWLKWSRQLAAAVDYIHSLGIIHHDIKPHNCLLTANKDLRLADFGNACFVPGFNPAPPVTDNILQSPSGERTSMSPEQTPRAPPSANVSPMLMAQPSTLSPTPDRSILSRPASAQSNNPQIFDAFTLSPSASPKHAAGAVTSPLHTYTGPHKLDNPPHHFALTSTFPMLPSPNPYTSGSSILSLASLASSSRYSNASLKDGLGRGTQAYTAPEFFTDTGEYSFPVDIYSMGVTMHVAATGIEPFALSRGSGVQMLMGIKKGYWASGMQAGVGPLGPDISNGGGSGFGSKGNLSNGESESGVTSGRPSAVSMQDERVGRSSVRKSVVAAIIQAGSGLENNRWINDDVMENDGGGSQSRSTSVASRKSVGGTGRVKFPGGEVLDDELVRIMCACLEKDPNVRPNARELLVWLTTLSLQWQS